MASTQSLIGIHKAQLEDPLAYLPRSNIRQYRRGEVIYDESKPLTYLYLLLSGSVMVSRVPTRGRHIVIDVHQPDDFFGESVLLGYPCTSEQALAAEDSRVMSWTRNDIEHII